MRVRINSENLNKKRRIDLSKIEKVVKSVLKDLGLGNAEVNIIFVSNQKIRAFNRSYLSKDRSTDVIAFPCGGEIKTGKKGKRSCIFLGDIAISSDKAAQNCSSYGMTFLEEIAIYVIHGILHLAGYDDTSPKKRAVMKKKENELLQKTRKFL